ncbi:uncharacterized protein LOC110115918 [Dendrobium catenatum]|uniref:Uncharacterized protein n=1 Tax=Dendrobium catenatum TaxID=906689 RepID=A0A2I0VZN6_9ASPA|nr:uncharacterized protein LOC110115918 [Dendrobium catenatum]PKU68870.1 hypothetical protein MA16_Dca010614 [Dendrobium catenatum]
MFNQMFRFLTVRTRFRLWFPEAGRSTRHLLHREPKFKTLIPFSSSPDPNFTVSFLETSCGLAPSVAIAAAAKTNLKFSTNAESVLSLLRNYGFTKSQIAVIASKHPSLFTYNAEKCIKPKIDLFVTAGFTATALTNLLSKYPFILKSSLERKLSPNLSLLMTILSGDRQAAASAISRSAWILLLDPNKRVLPNVETLRKYGVSDANIARLFTWCPRAITQEPGRFSKSVALVEEMGLKPSKCMFVIGINVVSGLTVATWERKMKLYRSLGWSQEETISAFRRSPFCMLLSEEKIRKIMGFFMKNLKWEPCRLASLPIVLSLSLENRIVPRYTVFNILTTRGLPNTKLSFPTLLLMSKSVFLEKCIDKYSDVVPELLEAYKVKL